MAAHAGVVQNWNLFWRQIFKLGQIRKLRGEQPYFIYNSFSKWPVLIQIFWYVTWHTKRKSYSTSRLQCRFSLSKFFDTSCQTGLCSTVGSHTQFLHSLSDNRSNNNSHSIHTIAGYTMCSTECSTWCNTLYSTRSNASKCSHVTPGIIKIAWYFSLYSIRYWYDFSKFHFAFFQNFGHLSYQTKRWCT
jgi:hypothetical protein